MVSIANTTSADVVLLSFKPFMEGDQIPDPVMEEMTRRLNGEIDTSARAAQSGVEGDPVAQRQAQTQSIAVGAQEMTFGWVEPFANTVYMVSFYPTSDPGAPIRVWIKNKTDTQIVFGIVGHTNVTSFAFIADP